MFSFGKMLILFSHNSNSVEGIFLISQNIETTFLTQFQKYQRTFEANRINNENFLKYAHFLILKTD
jgi:hypothetical protein